MRKTAGLMSILLPFVIPLAAISSGADHVGDQPWTPVLVERGETLNDFFTASLPETLEIALDPGEPPEGDYMGQIIFTRNGDRVLLTNRLTDNITVFDAGTMDVLENVEVGPYPGGLAVSDSYAVVTLGFSDSVVVVDLDDYSIVSGFPTGEQPWVVRVAPDGTRAYVSCDIDDVCEVIDLDNQTHVMTIPGFPIALASFSFNSENGRNSFVFTDFELTPDGQHLIVGGYRDSIFFYNTATGLVDHVIPDIPGCTSIELSGNDSVAIALSNTNPVVVHQIDLATYTKTGEVTVTGYSTSMSLDIGVNQDGSKAFISVSNNSSAVVRFGTSDFTIVTETLSPFWIGTSPDHSLAISGQYHFSTIDFATETWLGEHAGNAQHTGAISPVGSLAVAFDAARHEGVYFYDYADPAAPQYLGTTNAGLDPEGDAPRRVAITPDGNKAVVTNVLSDNATVIDLNTYTVEAILPMGDRVQDLAITSDSRYAVICGFNSNSVKILDLNSDSVVADVPTNTRAGVVSLTPDDEYAYVDNIQANTISVVKLDSSASAKVAELPCGEIGVVWAAYGVSSDVRVSPDGAYTLVAASFDDVIQVIDNASNTIAAAPTVGDFPIQIAFDTAGDYAIVTNYFGNTYSIIHVQGESSAVVAEPSVGANMSPLRLASNPVTDEIGVGLYSGRRVLYVDPRTGNVNRTDSYSGFGDLIQLEFGEYGDPIVLTGSDGTRPGHLHRFGQAIPLPAVPSYFDYCPQVKKACVTMPGPDYVTVISWLGQAVKEVVTVPLEPLLTVRPPFPSPFRSETAIRLSLSCDCRVSVSVCDRSGREVKRLLDSGLRSGEHSVCWNGTDSSGREVPSGVYFMNVRANGLSRTGKVVVLR